MSDNAMWTLLLTAALFSVGLIVLGLAAKALPLWAYIAASSLMGFVVAAAVVLPIRNATKKMQYPIFILLIVAILLWSFHASATDYQMIAFFDSYQEFVHLKLILADGKVDIGSYLPQLMTGPGFSTSYPIFAFLASMFTIVTGLDPLLVAIAFPMVFGLLLFSATGLFVRRALSENSRGRRLLLVAAVWFTVSPDMIYASTVFYHRNLALALGFLLFYFLLKYYLRELGAPQTAVLLILLLVLPLTHSVFPGIYVVFMVGFGLLTVAVRYGRRLQYGKSERRMRTVTVPTILFFSVGFLWNFMLDFPSPLSFALGDYVLKLLTPAWEVGDIIRFQTQAVIPSTLVPEGWTYLLTVRDVILLAPLVVTGSYLIVKFVLNRLPLNSEPAFVLLAVVSFLPMILADYATGAHVLRLRYYAFPLVAYSASFMTSILERNRRVMKAAVGSVLGFLVLMAFLSPFSHIYYPHHLYNPSLSGLEVGFPSPSYIEAKRFTETGLSHDGVILSDFPNLLTVVLDNDHLSQVRPLAGHYGAANSYVIEFVDFRPIPGYQRAEATTTLEQVSSSIDTEYSKVLDAGVFSVYFRPP